MSTTYAPNGSTWTAHDEQDWQAALDYAADQQRWPRDQRTPCHNADCDQLTDALFCSPHCREQVEGPDHEDAPILATDASDVDSYHPTPDRGTVAAPRASNGLSRDALPEAPASATVRLTVAGHADVLFTLRGVSEDEVLLRLERLLQRFPVATPGHARPVPPPQIPICQWHGAMKESTKVAGTWYCPNRMGDGSYCRERSPQGKGAPHG